MSSQLSGGVVAQGQSDYDWLAFHFLFWGNIQFSAPQMASQTCYAHRMKVYDKLEVYKFDWTKKVRELKRFPTKASQVQL